MIPKISLFLTLEFYDTVDALGLESGLPNRLTLPQIEAKKY